MECVSRGVHDAGGMVIGILPDGTGELGKALTYDLLINGNHVIINSRNREKLEKIVSEYLSIQFRKAKI